MRIAGVVFSAGLFFTLLACRAIAGIEDDPRPAGDAPMCRTATLGSDACRECMLGACCAEGSACGSDTACDDLLTCTSACAPDDTGCAAECRARNESGWSTPAISLTSCRAAHCTEACAVRCGGYIHPDRACAECGASRCCDESARCMGASGCAALVACERGCKERDTSCLLACELAHPESVPTARAFGACIADNCASSCITERWSCLKRPAEDAPATGGPISLTYRFIDYADPHPLVGLRVKACRATDLDCTSPLVAEKTTDANGTVQIDLGDPLFDGYVEVNGDSYGPILVFFPRLTKSYVTGTHPLLTNATYLTVIQALGKTSDVGGTVLASVRDCNGERAAGVQFTVLPSEGTTAFYSVGRLGVAAASETTDDGYSAGGFLNVAPNAGVTFGAIVRENGLTYRPRTVLVRPKSAGYTLTYLFAAPP